MNILFLLVCIELKTVYWGHEISWELLPQDPNDPLILSSCPPPPNTHYSSGATYPHNCQLTAGNKYELYCRDSYGDGWNGGYLTIQGTKYCGYDSDIANNYWSNHPNNPQTITISGNINVY